MNWREIISTMSYVSGKRAKWNVLFMQYYKTCILTNNQYLSWWISYEDWYYNVLVTLVSCAFDKYILLKSSCMTYLIVWLTWLFDWVIVLEYSTTSTVVLSMNLLFQCNLHYLINLVIDVLEADIHQFYWIDELKFQLALELYCTVFS